MSDQTTDSKETSAEPAPKTRKERSDKGAKRGPYKPRAPKAETPST